MFCFPKYIIQFENNSRSPRKQFEEIGERQWGIFLFFYQMLTKCYLYRTVADLGKGPEDQNEPQRAEKNFFGDHPAPHSAANVFFAFFFKGATLDIVSIRLVSNQGFCFRLGAAILTRWTSYHVCIFLAFIPPAINRARFALQSITLKKIIIR